MQRTVLARFVFGCLVWGLLCAMSGLSAAQSCVPDGDLYPLDSPDGEITLGDALVALRLAGGLAAISEAQTCRADVAPFADGAPQPDGKVTLSDAVLILRRASGLLSWPVTPPPAVTFAGKVEFRSVYLAGAQVAVSELYTKRLVHQTQTDQQGEFALPASVVAKDQVYLVEIDNTAHQDPNLRARIHALWFPDLSPTIAVNYLSEAVWRHVRAAYHRISPKELRAYLDKISPTLLQGASSFAAIQTFDPSADSYLVRHDLLGMLDADIARKYALKDVSEADLAMWQFEATRGELPADADFVSSLERKDVLLSLRKYGQGEVYLNRTLVDSWPHATFVARGSAVEIVVKPAAGYRVARVQGCATLEPSSDGSLQCTLTATDAKDMSFYFTQKSVETVTNLYDLSASDVAFAEELLRVVPSESEAAVVAGLKAGDFVYRTRDPVFLLKIEEAKPPVGGVYDFSVRPARLEEVIAKGGGYGSVFVVPDALRDVPEGVPVRSMLQGREVYLVRTPRTMLDGTFYILFPREAARSAAGLLNASYSLPSISLGPEGQPALEISGALAVRMGVEFYVDLGWFSLQEFKVAPWVELKPTLDLKFLVQYSHTEPVEKKARVIEGSTVVWIGVVPLVMSMGIEAGIGAKDIDFTIINQELKLSADLKFKYGMHYKNGSLRPVFALDPKLSMDFQKSVSSTFLSGKLFAYVLLSPYVKIYRGLVYFGVPLRTGPQIAFSAFNGPADSAGTSCNVLKVSVAGVFSAKPELKTGSCGKLCDALRVATQYVDRYLPEYTLTFAKKEYSPLGDQCSLGGKVQAAVEGQQEFSVRHGASFSQPVTFVLKNTGDQDVTWRPVVQQGKYLQLVLPAGLSTSVLSPGGEARVQGTLRLVQTPVLGTSLQAVDEVAIGFAYESGGASSRTDDLKLKLTVVKGLDPPTVKTVTAQKEGLVVSWAPPTSAPAGVSYFVAAKVLSGADCGQEGYAPVLQAPPQGQPLSLPLSTLQRTLGDLQGKTVCISMYSALEDAVSGLFTPAVPIAVNTQLQHQLTLLRQTYPDWALILPDQGDPDLPKELEQRWWLRMSPSHGARLILEQVGDCAFDLSGGEFFADAQAGAEFELAVKFIRPKKPGVYYCRFEVRDSDGGLYRIGNDDFLRLLLKVKRGRVYAYATHASGLTVIDVTDPRQPQAVAESGGVSYGARIASSYRNGRFYLYGTDGSLTILDITSPERPELVTTYVDSSSYLVGKPVFYGNLIFLNGGRVVDISNIYQPTSFNPFSDAGYYGMNINALQIAGSTIYTLDRDFNYTISAFDISNPRSPKIIEELVPGNDGVTLPYECSARPGSSDFIIYGNKIYSHASDGSVRATPLDYPDCNNQSFIKSYEHTYRECSLATWGPYTSANMVLAGGYAYVVNGCEFLIVNLANFTLAGRLLPNDVMGPVWVTVFGPYAYVSDGEGMKIIDVSTPSSPSVVSAVSLPDGAGEIVVLEQ